MPRIGDPNVIPAGRCYAWAWRDVQEHGGTLVHGIVREPFVTPAHHYWHGLSERDGIARDWQCMKVGYGGKWRGKGYPLDVFYSLYEPEHVVRYDEDLASMLMLEGGPMPGHRRRAEGPPKPRR